MSIGERLRAARHERKMSLADLARETHLSKGFISQVESGHSSPSLASLQKLVAALDLPTDGLFDSDVGNAPALEALPASFAEGIEIRVFSPMLDGGESTVPIVTGAKQGTAALLTLPSQGALVAPHPAQATMGTAFCAVFLGAVTISSRGFRSVVRQGEVATFDPGAPYELRSANGRAASLFLLLPSSCALPVRSAVRDRPDNLAPRLAATGPMRLVEMRASRTANENLGR